MSTSSTLFETSAVDSAIRGMARRWFSGRMERMGNFSDEDAAAFIREKVSLAMRRAADDAGADSSPIVRRLLAELLASAPALGEDEQCELAMLINDDAFLVLTIVQLAIGQERGE